MRTYINQIIATIQGEGVNIGKPSLLIRTSGCNLSCKFCDSKMTWNNQNGVELNKEKLLTTIYNKSNNYIYQNLMLTGGEPTIHFDNQLYIDFIKELIINHNIPLVEIETNGCFRNFSDFESLFKEIYQLTDNQVYISISPKQTGNTDILIENIIYCLESEYINLSLKIVHDDELLNWVIYNIFPIIPFIESMYLMPLTVFNGSDIDYDILRQNSIKTIDFCLKNNTFRFTPREHLWIYGNCVSEHEEFI